jgi:hypothetical protein
MRNKKPKRSIWLWILAGFLLCFVVGSIAGYAVFLLNAFPDWESRSFFGNSWAGLTTVFSGLGLLGVGLALVFQARELEAQGRAVEASLEDQVAIQEMLARQTRALALGAMAQVVFIQLDAKHRGFGSGSLKTQMDTLEELAEGMKRELEILGPNSSESI